MNTTTPTPVAIGLYGSNGHQIQKTLEDHPGARWVAAVGVEDCTKGVRVYADLDQLLADPEVELISICSARRDEQGEHIIRALEEGKHVYAEKPCCMDEATLDRIIETASRMGKRFHEMAATAFEQPYCTLREILASGRLGEIVQVTSQKSYPWGEWRPREEGIDGGLARQGGIYNVRFAEHVAGMKVRSLEIEETSLGNEIEGSDCRRAVSMLMTFENGGVGSAIINYLCPTTWPQWGYEIVRIFGTHGFVESIDNGKSGLIALEGEEPRPLDFSKEVTPFFDCFLQEIRTGRDVIPVSLPEELSPTRWVIRAKQ
jgi:predicted dehydrogenase